MMMIGGWAVFYKVLQLIEHQWNEIDRENRQLGEKPVPVLLCPPQISHGLGLGSNPGLRGERPATNRLSHGTASALFNFALRLVTWHWCLLSFHSRSAVLGHLEKTLYQSFFA
jgi:hypothetical protein